VTSVFGELAELGSATVYEAGGRRGYVDADLVQVVRGSRVARHEHVSLVAHSLFQSICQGSCIHGGARVDA